MLLMITAPQLWISILLITTTSEIYLHISEQKPDFKKIDLRKKMSACGRGRQHVVEEPGYPFTRNTCKSSRILLRTRADHECMHVSRVPLAFLSVFVAIFDRSAKRNWLVRTDICRHFGFSQALCFMDPTME